MDEISRIKERYAKRECLGKSKLYSAFNSAALFSSQQMEKSLINAFKRNGYSDLADKRILDSGCGNGGVLRKLVQYGAKQENLYGIDLLPDKIETAREISPNIHFECGNSEKLPYERGFFDIILVFTVFTSIFDPKMKENIASEALRVLKNGGSIIFYDFRYNNPKNQDVKKITKEEIISLFPGCDHDFELTTLAPPIARTFAPYSWLLCYVLEKIPLLRTHYLAVIKKYGKKA